MLQIFEDGVLTDNKGKTVDEKNAIFILTSNAGSELYSKQVKTLGYATNEVTEEKDNTNLQKRVVEYVCKQGFFKPEFLNHLDSMLVFNLLTDQTMKEIVDKQVEELKERIEKSGYKLE